MILPKLFMLFYILVYVFFLFLLIFVAVSKKEYPKTIILFFVLSISLVCGLRAPIVGTDTFSFYQLTKEMVEQNSFLWSKDYFYYGITRFFYTDFGYIGTVFPPTLITSLMLTLSYNEITKYDFNYGVDNYVTKGLNRTFYLTLSYFILISSSDFLFQIINQTRQLMSMSFALFGGLCLFKKDIFKAIIFFILATFSHHSAPLVIACFIGVYFLRSTKLWLILLALAIIFSLMGFSKYILAIAGLTIDRDSIYYSAINSSFVLYLKTMTTCFLGALCLFIARRRIKENGVFHYFINFYFAVCSLAVLLVVYGEASNRIQRYAGVTFPILFTMALSKVKIKEGIIVLIIFISMLYMMFFMTYDSTLSTIGVYRESGFSR